MADETLGAKLRKLRDDRKVSQQEIAARIGDCTQTKISAWERDEREPELNDLRDYFDALNVPEEERASVLLPFVASRPTAEALPPEKDGAAA